MPAGHDGGYGAITPVEVMRVGNQANSSIKQQAEGCGKHVLKCHSSRVMTP